MGKERMELWGGSRVILEPSSWMALWAAVWAETGRGGQAAGFGPAVQLDESVRSCEVISVHYICHCIYRFVNSNLESAPRSHVRATSA